MLKGELLKALDLDKNGDWEGAHNIIQDMGNITAYWIHAYLHRKQPDISNASYWYFRAKRTMPEYSFEQERKEIQDFISQTFIP